MKLIYKIDKKYDEEMLWEFMPTKGKDYLQKLANLLRVDIEDLDIEIKLNKNNLEKAIKSLVDKKYKALFLFFENSSKSYQVSWNKINNDFYKMVALKTSFPWKYNKYYCVISAYHEGLSNWGGNTVARIWSVNPDTQRKVTAHELALSHFWTILDNNKVAKEWSNNKKWKYSEILAWCLLDLDSDFHKFWPWLLRKHLFPENHQYQEIIPLQRKLKKLYFESKNFPDFLEKVIKIKGA